MLNRSFGFVKLCRLRSPFTRPNSVPFDNIHLAQANEMNVITDDSIEVDRDFTPTAEMLVHEFDDEATLDEEEEIEPLDSQLLELADLQRVGSS